jgi:hypothetical protein
MEGEINDMPDGEWVRFDDHLAALTAAQARCERLEEALQASRVAITYAIGALQGGLADSERQYLINVLVNDEQAARAALEEPQ